METMALASSKLHFSSSMSSIQALNPVTGFRNPGRRRCMGCRSQQNVDDSSISLPRRDVLVGSSAGLAGLSFNIFNQSSAMAAPIAPPDLSKCLRKDGESDLTCCLPVPANPLKDFVLPTPPKTLRVRPAAHLVSPDYADKYNLAYDLLRTLPDNDLRKRSNQANMHCVFCDGRYNQPGTSIPFDVHFTWLFLPWHRWYLYFHERILQKILGDPTFSLPYWNWDNQSDTNPLPNAIPSLYINNPFLKDPKRHYLHQPPKIADLRWVPGVAEGRQGDLNALRSDNNTKMYVEMVDAKRAEDFMGAPFRLGENVTGVQGTLEAGGHGHVHIWTGGHVGRHENMGFLGSAARDPIFFAHHGNVDRLWWIWKTRLAGQEFSDPDWLDAAFVFFDENGDPVKVKVRDCLSTDRLGYLYQDMPLTWLNAKPTNSGGATVRSTLRAAPKSESFSEFGSQAEGKSKSLDSPFTSKLVPKAKSMLRSAPTGRTESEGDRTLLLLQGVEFPMDEPVGFDVFINLPGADISTPLNIIEYAGSFVNLPHGAHKEVDIRMNISNTLKNLGIKKGESFNVTLVPQDGGKKPLVVKGIELEQ